MDMNTATISVCMIVKNEEQVLARALDGVSLFADEIIVVDTGSTDHTMEIAAKYTDKVYAHPWEDHFGKMRNISYSYATCDYVMYFDADYVIDEENAAKINQLKQTLTNENSICIISTEPESKVSVELHMLSRRDERKWQGAVHERIPLKEPILHTDIVTKHIKNDVVRGEQITYDKSHWIRNAKLFSKLTEEEFREHYWLVAQCYSDSVLAEDDELSKHFFALSQDTRYDFLEKNAPSVRVGQVLLYYGKYEEGLQWLDAYLTESAHWFNQHKHDNTRDLIDLVHFFDEKACCYAIKCAASCMRWEHAQNLLQRMSSMHGDSMQYAMTNLWLEREMKKGTSQIG